VGGGGGLPRGPSKPSLQPRAVRGGRLRSQLRGLGCLHRAVWRRREKPVVLYTMAAGLRRGGLPLRGPERRGANGAAAVQPRGVRGAWG
jgi:hypothetical protein